MLCLRTRDAHWSQGAAVHRRIAPPEVNIYSAKLVTGLVMALATGARGHPLAPLTGRMAVVRWRAARIVVLVLACVVRSVSPSASERPARAVVSAVSRLHAEPHAVVPALFDAAHELLASGDALGALRVLALCRRLAGADANVELAAAGILCRTGHVPAAHAGFRLARALAGRLCPEIAQPPQGREASRDGCPDAERRQARELMVAASARHGMCLMEARMFTPAAARFRDALAVDEVATRCVRRVRAREMINDFVPDMAPVALEGGQLSSRL